MTATGTLLDEISKARADARRIAERCNQFLARCGATPVELPQAGKLRLALLGRYNAGKSTLVNALLGEKCAQTGDAPTTREVHAYDWREFHVLDLPGTDARLEEERKSLGAVREAHAVLYVVSSDGGIEQSRLWEDVRFLDQRDLPYVVVLNDKQPHQNDEAERAWRVEVGDRFRRLADERLGPGRNPEGVFWVNALRAEKARLARNEAWAARSGIVPLEIAVADRFYRNDPILRDLDLLSRLAEALDDLRHDAARRVRTADCRVVAEAVDRLEQLRCRLRASAQNVADARFAHLADALGARLSAAVLQDAGVDEAASEVTAVLQETLSGAIQTLHRVVTAELAAFVAAYRALVSAAPVPSIDDTLHLALGRVPRVSASKESNDVVQRIAAAAAAGAEIYSRLVAAEARALGAAARASGAALRAGSTAVARAAGGGRAIAAEEAACGAESVGRFVGAAVIVTMVAWEIYQGLQQVEVERRARELACREAVAKAKHGVATARDQFLGRTAAWLVQATDPLERQLRSELESRTQSRTSAEGIVAEAAELAARARDVRGQLASRTRGSEGAG